MTIKSSVPMKHIMLLLSMTTTLLSCNKDDFTASSENTQIEEKFSAIGPSSISETTLKDNNNQNYKVFYPSIMNDKTPVITWGNGTGLSPEKYAKIFRHLASWGFIVIDNYEGSTFDGSSILQSVRLMVRENNISGSIFYQKVATDKIAASGHSQGAGGVVNAYADYPDGNLIKTIVPVAFPSILKAKATNVKVPIFFIAGKEDGIFSSVGSNLKSYEGVPKGVPAVLAVRKGAYHEAVINTTLVTGYLTAWMRYQLMNDPEASLAFRGSNPEILLNPNWTNSITKSVK